MLRWRRWAARAILLIPMVAPAAWAQPRVLAGHRDAVTSLSVTRDGRRLLSSGADGTLRLWDLDSGRPLRKLVRQRQDAITSAVVDPHGSFAVSASANERAVVLWDLERGREWKTLAAADLSSETYRIGLSPDGALALADGNYRLILWEVPSGREVWTRSNTMGASGFTPDQAAIIGGGYQGEILVLDAQSGSERRKIQRPGPAYQSYGSLMAISPRGDYVLATSRFDDDRLERWDLGPGKRRWAVPTPADGDLVVIGPDGRLVASAGRSKYKGLTMVHPRELKLRAAATGAVTGSLPLPAGEEVSALAFAPDGRFLLVGLGGGKILCFARAAFAGR